jgi:hypothetical protein
MSLLQSVHGLTGMLRNQTSGSSFPTIRHTECWHMDVAPFWHVSELCDTEQWALSFTRSDYDASSREHLVCSFAGEVLKPFLQLAERIPRPLFEPANVNSRRHSTLKASDDSLLHFGLPCPKRHILKLSRRLTGSVQGKGWRGTYQRSILNHRTTCGYRSIELGSISEMGR